MYKHLIRFCRSQRGRLMLTYLGVIMVVSIGYSVVIYMTASRQLERQAPPPSAYGEDRPLRMYDRDSDSLRQIDPDDFFRQRTEEGNGELFERLVYLNILTFVVGCVISYGLARWIVRPTDVILATQQHLLGETGQFPELDELTALQAAKLTPKSVALEPLVSKAKEMTKELVHKHITVETTSLNVKVHADAASITRLFEILLANAAQYSAEHTTIHVVAEQKGKKVAVSVRDEGIGVNRSDIPYLFTPFYQADHTRPLKDRPGTGLGLAIVRMIAEKNGGKIKLKSGVDVGTVVTVELPSSR